MNPPNTTDWDAELRQLIDQGDRDRRHDATIRLLIIMCGFTLAGIFLMAALVAMMFAR